MRRQLFVNGALVALALGTLGVVWATREAPTTAELTARKNKLLPDFKKELVSRIVLSRGGHELELEAATPGEFRIVKPWPERADVATVSQLLGSLDLASALRSAEDVSTGQAALGSGALSIRVEMGAKYAVLALGGPAPSPTGAHYAEVTSDGVSKRYVVTAGVAAELGLPFDKFREPRLLEYGRSELAKISLVQGNDKLELTQAEHGAFFVELGGSRELASRDVVERLLTAFARLSTEQFVEADAARQALSGSTLRATLTLTDKQAQPITLAFGTCPSDPAQALVLKEQAGKGPRAGCIPADVGAALRVNAADARLSGPFAARVDEVEELRVSQGSQKLDLARKDRGFLLRAPSNTEVPLDAGNARISAILSAKGQRPTAPKLAELGLLPSQGDVSIQIAGADEAAHRSERVLVGKKQPDGGVCVQRLADQIVLCFDAEVAHAFEPDATLLKGLNLFRFAPSELQSFTLEAKGLRQTVKRSPEGGYTLEEPKGFKHDGALVADAVQTLGTLQAVRWVPAGDPASVGLEPPRLRVSITLAEGAGSRDLFVGGPTAGGFFARASTDPGVFVLSRSNLDALATPLIERALLPVPEAELASIQVDSSGRSQLATRVDERWQGALSADVVEAILALKAEQTAHLGAELPAEGLAKPATTVRFTAKTGQQFRLRVGASDTLSGSPIAYARLDGVDATFALSARAATMLRDATDPNPRE
jgi:Domain of unknown function (DUF4340)